MVGHHDVGSYPCPECGNLIPEDCGYCSQCGWEADGEVNSHLLYLWYRDHLVPDAAEENFEAGREKYGSSWQYAEPDYLYRRFEEEILEFRQAAEHYRDEGKAIKEMGDIVNSGLFYLARLVEEGVIEEADDGA